MFWMTGIFSQDISEPYTYKELEETGNYEKALLLVNQKLENDSLNPNLWSDAAKLYRLNQQYKKAILAIEKAIKLDPVNKRNVIFLARINKMAGKHDEAQKIYLDLLKSEPNNIMALSDLAEIYMTNKISDSAANTYQKLAGLDTLNVDYLFKWANNQWNSGNHFESLDNYKKALKIDPYYLPVIYDLSRIFVKLRMQDTAITILENNIKHYPDESGLYAETGHVYFSMADYKSAIFYFEKAVSMGQRGFELYRRLGISYYSVQEYEKSRDAFELLIKKDTSDYKICLYLGHIYNVFGQGQKSLDFLNRSLALITPDSMTLATIYSGIVRSYQIQKKYAEQIDAIIARQEIIPESYKTARYLEEIAEIYERNLNNKQKAVEYYQNYYNSVKDIEWLSKETKDQLVRKINKLQKEVKSPMNITN